MSDDAHQRAFELADYEGVRQEVLAAIGNQAALLRFALPVGVGLASLGFGLEDEPVARLLIVAFFAPCATAALGFFWLDEHRRMMRGGTYLVRVARLRAADGGSPSFVAWKRSLQGDGRLSRFHFWAAFLILFSPCLLASAAAGTILYDPSHFWTAALVATANVALFISSLAAARSVLNNRSDNSELSIGY